MRGGEPVRRSSASRRTRKGYCQHYATTMAIFLRELGIPARIAEGFLPGDRDERTGIETLLGRNRHQWVEVYFPGYGWVPFDPTGGGVSQLEPLPTGAPLASGDAATVVQHRARADGVPHAGSRDEGRRVVGGVAAGRRPDGRPARCGGGPARGGGRRPDVHDLAARSARRDVAGSRVRLGHPAGRAPRLRPATEPDRVRVRRRAGRGPARGEAPARDGRPGQGRVHVRAGLLGEDGLAALREAERRLRVMLLRLLFRRDRRPRR